MRIGNRRLDDPNDFVRIEIGAALQRDIPVIPILLDGARIPKPSELPDELKELASRNGLDVRHASFHSDIDRLIIGLKGQLDQVGAPEGVDDLAGGDAPEFATKMIRVSGDQSHEIVIEVGSPGRSVRRDFSPGAGKTEWFQDAALAPEMVVIPRFVHHGFPARRRGSTRDRRTATRGPHRAAICRGALRRDRGGVYSLCRGDGPCTARKDVHFRRS
jgi:hypothetical protein